MPSSLFGTDLGVLSPFVSLGLLGEVECHFADAVASSVGDHRSELLLAAGFAIRAVRSGDLVVDLDVLADEIAAVAGDEPAFAQLELPDPERWVAVLRTSPAVRCGDLISDSPVAPLVLEGRRIYLDRYFAYEETIAEAILERARSSGKPVGPDGLCEVLDHLFGPTGGTRDPQRRAVEAVFTGRIAIVAGGPGTGKTWTIARLLAAVRALDWASGRDRQVAICAPTGKAASRLGEAISLSTQGDDRDEVSVQEAVTIHRLLGADRTGNFRRGPERPLPYDLVIVDEASMISASLMAHLLGALSPDASLVLVGDPFQLASVDAGAVLGEIVSFALGADALPALRDRVVILDRVHRFGADSVISALADAVRQGDAATVLDLVSASSPHCTWIRPDDRERRDELVDTLATVAGRVVELARLGAVEEAVHLAARMKVLAATKHGPLGSHEWQREIEGRLVPRGIGVVRGGWYVGRPVIVMANDYPNQLFNGETGVAFGSSRGLEVAFLERDGLRKVRAAKLREVETWWSMTVHKSQGSEFEEIVVSLPDAGSLALGRELLYTAITRAKSKVTIVASEEAIVAATNGRAPRRSGLAERLARGVSG